MTSTTAALLLLLVDLAVALVVAALASRQAWSDRRHPVRMPLADSAWTSGAVCAIALLIGLFAYALDRRHAPVFRAVEAEYGRAPAA